MNKNAKNFIGHSGCLLKLIQADNGKWYVRKISKDINYNKRLVAQMLKQENFENNSKEVYAPLIVKTENANNLFSFDMEYIDGQNMSHYIVAADLTAINLLIYKLLNCLDITYDKSKDSDRIFRYKISKLNFNNGNESELFNEAFNKLNSFDWSNVHFGLCHGDLTLENILISNLGDIYLIDFLDSFFNSWMIDVAKILQDLELGWSYRFEPEDTNRNIRLNSVKNRLINKILELKDGEEIVYTIYHLLLLNLIRIYPYTSESRTFDFLNKSTQKVINIINGLKKGELCLH